MKKFLLLALMMVGISASAQFTSDVSDDAFDGTVVYVYGRGSGGKFPYSDPTLVFRHKADKFQFYITGAGYVNGDNKTLKVIIDKDKSKLYEFKLSPSVDGDAGFIYSDEETTLRFIKDLQSGNRAYFRFQTDYSYNTFEMSLSGANASLNNILSLIEGSFKQKAEEKRLKKEKLDELFVNYPDVRNNELNTLDLMFDYYLKKQGINLFDVDSLRVSRRTNSLWRYGYVDIFVTVDGVETKVDGHFRGDKSLAKKK